MIQIQILDPLYTFSENFNSSIFESIKNTKESFFKLEESREIMHRKRENYLLASTRAEKAEKAVLLEDEEDRLDLAQKNAEEMRAQALKSSEDYFTSVAQEKQFWGDCEEYRHFCINSLRESEESRVEFIKKLLLTHFKQEKKLLTQKTDSLKDPIFNIQQINSSQEAKNFVEHNLDFQQVNREEWIDYEMWKKNCKLNGQDPLANEELWISNKIPYVPMDGHLACIRTVVYGLLPPRNRSFCEVVFNKNGIEVEEKDLVQLELILEDLNTWPQFFEAVEYRKFALVHETSKIGALGRVFWKVLSVLQREEPGNFKYFYRVVSISHQIFVSNQDGKVYLFRFLAHPIFQNPLFWKGTIETVISERVDSEKKIFKKNLKKLKKNKTKTYNPGKFEEKLAEKNSAVMFLSQFSFYMVNLKVELPLAIAILQECSKKAQLEPQKLTNIIIELHSISPDFKFEKSLRSKSSRQGSKLRGRWGSYLYLGLSLKFLQKHEIVSLLQVCKTWNNILKPWYLQKELLSYKNLKIRDLVWKFVLVRPMGKDYTKIFNEFTQNAHKIKQFEDVIMMDVLRSYNNKGLVDLDAVKEILRVYSYFNSKVGYCQGMNYIAGTINIVIGDKSQSFWAMDELIRINSMSDLFSEELSKLKFFFFALDRLIALNLPDVFETLISETIMSSAFSSSWFLTLFGALLSHYFELQLQIWDLFIYKGWKIIFKVAILILKKLKPQIMWKKYEEIMCLLTGIQNSPHMSIFEKGFLQDLATVKVTNRMISQIRREYDKLKGK